MTAKRKVGGRYTPKGGGSPDGPRLRRSTTGTPEPAPQVGRRPSPPGFLFLIALLWFAAAIVVAWKLEAAWKLVPAVVFGGIAVFYVRAALQTVVRHEGGHEARRGAEGT